LGRCGLHGGTRHLRGLAGRSLRGEAATEAMAFEVVAALVAVEASARSWRIPLER